MKLKELKNKKIAILWFWKEWKSSLSFLQKEGIDDITVLDINDIVISDTRVKVISGEWYLDNLDIYDVIIKSPWVSPFQEKLIAYRNKFVSQTQIFFENYNWKIIWLTGTKGKSTCSTLLYELLKNLNYKVRLVWNIWSPVLDEIHIDESYDYVVYELSSYMLQDFSPKLTVWYLNNIYPCHLDWHYDSLNIYKEAKINILREADIKIIHGDFALESGIVHIKEGKVLFDSKWSYTFDKDNFYVNGKIVYSWSLGLNWNHNKKNICWVIAILDQIWVGEASLIHSLYEILPVFKWLPHRIEDIWVYEDIRFINDAIATTPQSTIAAIDTFDGNLQTLFIWWQDSWFNFSELRERIMCSSIQNIIAFPDTSNLIFPEIEIRDYDKAFEIELEGKTLQFIKTKHMSTWVDFAYKTTLPGKTAMLSCASPSFSLWKSYVEKAEDFINAVKEY